MNSTAQARRLRREQTQEEKSLWKALRAGRFAGFKFRRQHPFAGYVLDFYCPLASLAVELDGFRHGHPQQAEHDSLRHQFLQEQGIEVLRFWNHQWRHQREGVLLEIWNVLHHRTGCTTIERADGEHRYVPPHPDQIHNPTTYPHPKPTQLHGP